MDRDPSPTFINVPVYALIFLMFWSFFTGAILTALLWLVIIVLLIRAQKD